MVAKMAKNMFKLKIDPNIMMFGFCCKFCIYKGGAMVVFFVKKWPTTYYLIKVRFFCVNEKSYGMHVHLNICRSGYCAGTYRPSLVWAVGERARACA